MKLFNLGLMSLTCMMTLSSCTPTLQEPTRTPPKTEFYPDTEVVEEVGLNGSVEAFPMVWNGTINTEDYFELVTNLIEQSNISRNSKLRLVALNLVNKLERVNYLTPQVSFKNTPFFEILINKAEPQVRTTIEDVLASLPGDLEKVKNLIESINKEFQWPTESTIDQSVVWIQSFMNELVNRIPSLKLNARIESALVEQLKKQSAESLKILRESSEKLKQEKTLSGAIRVIEEMVTQFEFPMDKKTQQLLKSGKRLGKKIDTYKDADGALGALLEIWLMLDKKGRVENIKPVSPELYDFLKDKSDSTVRCIITPGCFSPWQDFLADFFIKPKLEDFGLEKLRRQLNAGTYTYTVTAVEAQVTATLSQLAKQISDKIDESVNKERKGIEEINANVLGYVQLKVNKWGTDLLEKNAARLSSYEKPRLEVKLLPNLQLELNPSAEANESASAAIGAGLETYSYMLSFNAQNEKEYTRIVINQLNRLLGFGGIEIKPKVITTGIMRAFEGEKEKFDLPTAPHSPFSFVLVDTLPLKAPFSLQNEVVALNISAESQSFLLNGLLEFMHYMKDWLKTDFDRILGEKDAGELFTEDGKPVEPVGQKLFPKEQLFALSFAHVGNLLKNITKEKTPFILFAESGQRLWANQMESATAPVTMAGVVDIKNGERSDIIRSQNVSRWIISLGKALQRTQDIENTRAPELTQRGEDGSRSAVESLKESRKDIINLIIALGNLLSSQMIKEGLVSEAIKLTDLSDISRRHSLMDHLLAIDALLTIHEVTKMKTYLWSALDIYKHLRKVMNPDTNFFEFGNEKISNPLLTSFLARSMSHLIPYLKPVEQQSLRRQIKIWNAKLEKLQ